MTNRVLDCEICGKPVEGLPARRYKRLRLSGKHPTHVKCRRRIEQRGKCKRRRAARTSQTRAIPGVAGVSMSWQTNLQQCKGGPLAKAIVSVNLPSTYGRGVAVTEGEDE